MRGYSNLPPGCSVTDIPGNRPEDEAFERWAERVYESLGEDITEAIDSDMPLSRAVEEEFFTDVDFVNVLPETQAEKIEEYVDEWREEE